MRFQFFIFNVLCLCYVISAFPNENFAENKNRPKRTLILASTIKKLLWRKFSNFINLPITRRPSSVINFTTESYYFPILGSSAPNNFKSVNKNKKGQIPSFSKQRYGPTVSSSTGQNYDINSGPFSGPEAYTDRRKGPGKQMYYDDQPISGASGEKQNVESSSSFRNSGRNYEGSTFSGPGGYTNHQNAQQRLEYNNSIEKNRRPIPDPNNQHFGPTSSGFPYSDSNAYNNQRKQESTLNPSTKDNYKQPNDADKQSFGSATEHTSDSNQQQQQKSILKEEQLIDYSFNQNNPSNFEYSKSQENNENHNSQLESEIQNSEFLKFPEQKNSQLDNLQVQIQSQNDARQTSYPNVGSENNAGNFIQERNPISQPNPNSTPFLINYPHHQHYQQLIPNLSDSIAVPQNNYQQQPYYHNQDSADFNEFNQPVLNYYPPEQQYQ